MIRSAFLYGTAAVTIGATTPSPTPCVTPGATRTAPPSYGPCDRNFALPLDKPIEFTQASLDGPDIILSTFRGKPVWINIFAAWCEDCNDEQPTVTDVAKEFGPKGVHVIGIDCGESDDTARRYKNRYGIEYPIVMDRGGGLSTGLTVGRRGGEFNLPSHLFLDRNGYLVCFRADTLGWRELRPKLTTLLAN